MATYAAETFSAVTEAADRLGRAHWAELYGETPYPAELQKVAELQDEGGFAYFVAKDSDGAIVGHVGFLLLYSPVHACKLAIDAFYYVDPAHRSHGTARKLLRHAGEALTADGIGTVLVSCQRGVNLGQMIEGAGYRRSATMFSFAGD